MKLQDLKRGMRCTSRTGKVGIIDIVNSESGTIKYISDVIGIGTVVMFINDDLTYDNSPSLDIVKVEDITTNGYKTIWEREDKKYYLKIPEEYGEEYYVNYRINEESFFLSNKDELGGFYKTKFTEEEIYKLPRQNFIQGLAKVEVK